MLFLCHLQGKGAGDAPRFRERKNSFCLPLRVMEEKMISILIPTFNRAHVLRRCIDSALGQSFEDREIVVSDGGSTDGTLEILNSYRDKIKWHTVKRPMSEAGQILLGASRGDWLVMLGDDDFFWTRHVLENMKRWLEAVPPNVPCVYGRTVRVDAAGNQLEVLGVPWDEMKRWLYHYQALPTIGLFWRRSVLKNLGRIPTQYTLAGDYDTALSALLYSRAVFAHDVVVAGLTAGGISQQNRIAALKESIAVRKKHGLPFSWRLWLGILKAKIEGAMK